MSWLYRTFLRPMLFSQEAEEVHERTLAALALASRRPVLGEALSAFYAAPPLPVEAFGLPFPNPVGLAAGMDKAASALPAWAALGFGFSELGAVTWHAQPGNPPPRLFRVIPDQAIINRMGFNNPGALAVAQKLQLWKETGRWPAHPVGMNLGKSKITPLEKAAEDYADSFRVLRPWCDFFVVNVSSPNTPQLRALQDRNALADILDALDAVQHESATPPIPRRPVLVKVAPDLTFEALDEIMELAAEKNLAGVVATNTTIHRPDAPSPNVQKLYAETGGLSGRPLAQRGTEVIRHLHKQSRGRLTIIGVGGIFTAADAWEKIAAGASLIQVYTGLVYEGPSLAKEIVTGLMDRLEQNGLHDLRQVVGLNA